MSAPTIDRRSVSEPRTVGSVLADAAARWPQQAAVVIDGQRVSYEEMVARAARMRETLLALGVKQGDALLVMLENCIEFVDVFAACGIEGIVQVPVNTEYRGNLLKHAVEVSGAKVMIVDAAFASRLDDVAPFTALERVAIVGETVELQCGLDVRSLDDVDRSQPGADDVAVRECDPIAIMYTSGTTGPSKGVLVANRHAYQYAYAAATVLELREGDVYYAPLPLFHIAGQWAMLYASWIVGGTAIIKRRFSVHDFWDDVRAHGATTTFLLGAMAQFLHAQSAADHDRDNTLDRVLMVPLVADLEGFRERFDVRVTTCYGSTDVNVPLRADFDVTDTTVAGTPFPGYEVRLVDHDDNEVADDEVGELCVRPPEPWMTLVEYVGNPEATAHALRNMWLHSGDMFRRDADGNYHFVDRLKDAIRRRGENISSFEVECEVNAHPAVAESAAIGVPSRNTEDDLGVVVVPRQGMRVDEAELREFIATRAPKFMVPDVVWVLDEMPKTPTGKIQKHILRAQFAAERDSQASLRKQETDTG